MTSTNGDCQQPSVSDDQYAPCFSCGASVGIGLSADVRGFGFVRCFCGSRGPFVRRSEFVRKSGFDVVSFDAAARRAWRKFSDTGGAPLTMDANKKRQEDRVGNRIIKRLHDHWIAPLNTSGTMQERFDG